MLDKVKLQSVGGSLIPRRLLVESIGLLRAVDPYLRFILMPNLDWDLTAR